VDSGLVLKTSNNKVLTKDSFESEVSVLLCASEGRQRHGGLKDQLSQRTLNFGFRVNPEPEV
jgi:hypothetical protein